MILKKWDLRFLELAKFIASWSKDPSTKVGSVIVDSNNRVVSTGYNGFPQKIKDTKKRLNNRDIKYKMVLHAERNALIFAQRSLEGCTIYTYPFQPCAGCASMIIQAGIIRVVAPKSNNPRWKEEFKLARQLFKEAKIPLDLIK